MFRGGCSAGVVRGDVRLEACSNIEIFIDTLCEVRTLPTRISSDGGGGAPPPPYRGIPPYGGNRPHVGHGLELLSDGLGPNP